LRIFRRLFAGQMLAHDEPKRIGQRGFGTIARFAQPARVAARFESCREIGGDALHRQRADGFDTRLFRRFEDRSGVGGLRPQLIVQRIFVIGPAQRIGVACAAHDRDFRRRQIARRQGQPRLQPFEGRRLGAEIHFQFRLTRE
jgi:hypothetical protein